MGGGGVRLNVFLFEVEALTREGEGRQVCIPVYVIGW